MAVLLGLPAEAATLPTGDGLRLGVSPAGRVTSLRIGPVALPLKAEGGFALADFKAQPEGEGVYRPVTGKVTGKGSQLTFRGVLPGSGLELDATLMGGQECLRVEGVVRDTTGEDRAVGVKFSLPLDLEGWTWFRDAEERETIQPGLLYRHTYDCLSGVGRCSIYPWMALNGPRAGLSLALPLSQGPRVFLLQHDQKVPETAVIFFFGLAREAGRNPSRAPFSFVLYSHDPAWGLRSTMQKYYRLFPESFTKRPTFEGYLNYADLERFDPQTHRLVVADKPLDDASDFGEGYRFLWHLHGCYDFRQVPYDDPRLPPDETVFSLLQRMVEEEQRQPRSYTPTAELLKKIVFGPQGQICYIGDTRYWRPHEGYNRTDQAGWGFNFRVHEDPEVSPFLADLARRQAEAYAQTPHRPWDAAFTADAIEGYFANTSGLDYRREHFRTTQVPLTFGCQNLKPALPNTIWDFHEKCWKPLTDKFQIVTYGNANGYEQIFTMPYVDVPMTEGNWDPQHDGRLDRFMRAIAYRKIWRYWHAWDRGGGYGDRDPANVLAHFRRGLAYAIYPAVYCIEVMGGDLEAYRAQFRQYVPAIEELSTAGWDPVPYATASGSVIVERFGAFTAGELHFTLRNYEDRPVKTMLTLHRRGLQIPQSAKLVAMDLLPRSPHFFPFPQEGLPVVLEPAGSQALWVGTRAQAAQHGFRLAVASLAKLERFYGPEMREAGKATWERALRTAQAGTQAGGPRALALAEELQHLAEALEKELTTAAPVDLAKLLYRVRVEASYAPVALLGLALETPRLIADVPCGAAAEAPWQLTWEGPARPTDLTARVVSPWPEVTDRCAVQVTSGKKNSAQGKMQLYLPPEPPRRLMVYLLELRGKVDRVPFTVAVPVDVQAGLPLEVQAVPERVFRGQAGRLRLTIRNRLPEAAKVTMQLSPPAKVEVTPAEFALDLPPRGHGEQMVTLALDKNVAIGGLRLHYACRSDDVRWATAGCFDLQVSDPVPRGAIRRVTTPPTVDGKLTETLWREPPLIPELRLLANGAPATEKTTVWAAYDAQGLYVAFRCHDSQMERIVARYTERGAPLYLDDDVELFLFPPGAPQVYQFAVNALGTRSDNFGNRTDWQAAAQRADQEWTVEVFIPYRVVGEEGPPPAGLAWGMQFGRQQKSKGETTSWTPGSAFIDKDGFGEVVFE